VGEALASHALISSGCGVVILITRLEKERNGTEDRSRKT